MSAEAARPTWMELLTGPVRRTPSARPGVREIPSVESLRRRIEPHIGSSRFPDVLASALQEAYAGVTVVVEWGDRVMPAGTTPSIAPWLSNAGVSVWLPSLPGDDDLRAWVATVIVAQMALERALRHETDLESRVAFQARVLSVLAHEIRNPLTVVMGALELASKNPIVPTPVARMLASARSTASRIESLSRAAVELAKTSDPAKLNTTDHFSVKHALLELIAR